MDNAPDSISNIEPNAVGLALARALRAGKGGLNALGTLPQSVPLLGGQGAGDLIFGKGPEAAESWAHGFPPTTGAGMTSGLKPEAMDLALTPLPAGLIAGGAKMAGQKLLAKMLRKETEATATDVGRREFLKKGAALTAAGAGAAVIPDVVKLAMTGTGKKAAVAIGAHVAEEGAAKLLSGLKSWHGSKEMTDWLDEINIGSNSGTWEGTVKDLVDSIHANPPIEEMRAVTGHIPTKDVHPDLLRKLYQNENYHGGGSNVKPLPQKTYDEFIASPKLQQQYADYMVTGKLPKGAPEYFKRITPADVPSDTPLGKLWNKVWEHVSPNES